jgi:hypothetical protein
MSPSETRRYDVHFDYAHTVEDTITRIRVAAYPRLRSFNTNVAAADASPAILEKSK